MKPKKQRVIDTSLQSLTYLASFMSAFALGMIMLFVFRNGIGLLSFDLFTTNYHARHYVATIDDASSFDGTIEDVFDENHFVVIRYGIVLTETKNLEGNTVIKVAYVHEDSPFNTLLNQGQGERVLSLQEGATLNRVTYVDAASSLTRHGAQRMALDLDENDSLREVMFSYDGGGIRGSVITTLYLIGLTLLFAMSFGVLSAVYFNEYAPSNKVTSLLRSFIEMLTGVPSIVFGLIGVSLFIPLTIRLTSSQGGNLYAGALTLSIILLPVIIRTTEESLKVIPMDDRYASLALGANHTQTTFKVVLPQAVPGILTATFLAIGRIIGESAALIFVLGTAIRDTVRLNSSSTSLAVQIWSLMTDEPANIDLASSIALIIMIVVLILNITIKLTSHMLKKRG